MPVNLNWPFLFLFLSSLHLKKRKKEEEEEEEEEEKKEDDGER